MEGEEDGGGGGGGGSGGSQAPDRGTGGVPVVDRSVRASSAATSNTATAGARKIPIDRIDTLTSAVVNTITTTGPTLPPKRISRLNPTPIAPEGK